MSYSVLHLIDHLNVGGAQRIVSDLADEQGHKVFGLRQSKDKIKEKKNLTCAESSNKYNIKCLFETLNVYREKDFEIVHCHLFKAKIVGVLLKLIPGIDFKLVFHEHGRIFKKQLHYRIFLKVASRVVDRNIAVSKKTRDLLTDLGLKKEKVDVVYNYADGEKFNPEVLNDTKPKHDFEPDIPTEEFVVGFAGRLIERKGWRTLVNALELLDQKTSVIIVGDGPDSAEIKKIISDKPNIYYKAYIEDIRTLLGSIDCFIIPSKWDPCPMTFFEAQSSGVPVICSDSASLNELVNDRQNGLVFTAGNPVELSEKILELKRDPKLRDNLVKEGFRFASNHLKKDYISKLDKTYEKVGDS